MRDEIAKMLSPKRKKESASAPSLGTSSYDTFIEQPSVAQALEKITLGHLKLDSKSERQTYSSIVKFLNICLDNCKTAYGHARASQPLLFPDDPKSQLLESPFLAKLRYFVYDKPTKDSVDRAAPLKPDGAGIFTATNSVEEISCSWSRMSDPKIFQIIHPVEVKDSWRDLILQSATYARALFSAAPFRSYALVIGVNHKRNSLRFLIFHSGGLTSSEELKLDSNEDLRSIQEIWFSIYSSQTPEDAGLANFTNGYIFQLPKLGQLTPQTWILDEVIYIMHAVFNLHWTTLANSNPAIEQLESRVCLLVNQSVFTWLISQLQESAKRIVHLPSSQPTTAATTPSYPVIHQGLYLPHNMQYEPPNITFQSRKLDEGPTSILKLSYISNSKRNREADVYSLSDGLFGTPSILQIFEPQGLRKVDVSNSIFLPSEKDVDEKHDGAFTHKRTGIKPEMRTPCLILASDEGKFLEQCQSPWDLMECILHAMLGWLNYYQKGYLHRDVSIGNVLKLKVPAIRTPFTTRLVQSLLPNSDKPRPLKKTKFVHSVEETSMQQTITGEETRKATEHDDAFWVNLLSNTEEGSDARAVVNEARQ
ncbi:hypothetical protein H0H93_007201, partial [Arthromyces matolae]